MRKATFLHSVCYCNLPCCLTASLHLFTCKWAFFSGYQWRQWCVCGCSESSSQLPSVGGTGARTEGWRWRQCQLGSREWGRHGAAVMEWNDPWPSSSTNCFCLFALLYWRHIWQVNLWFTLSSSLLYTTSVTGHIICCPVRALRQLCILIHLLISTLYKSFVCLFTWLPSLILSSFLTF